MHQNAYKSRLHKKDGRPIETWTNETLLDGSVLDLFWKLQQMRKLIHYLIDCLNMPVIVVATFVGDLLVHRLHQCLHLI